MNQPTPVAQSTPTQSTPAQSTPAQSTPAQSTPALSTPALGSRQTRQRAAILAALAQSQQFCSAQQLHDLLVQTGQRIGLTTVYRTLQALVAAELVDVVRTDTEQMYRACSPHHHHHLVCRDCSATVEIEDLQVERWASRSAASHGFTDVTHTLEMFGRCPTCAQES